MADRFEERERGHGSRERDEFDTSGDWGQQGYWGTFGNRPDYGRAYEWRCRGQNSGHRSQDWPSGRRDPDHGGIEDGPE